MQRMARPGTKAYPDAGDIAPQPGYVALLLVDALLHGVLCVASVMHGVTGRVPGYWPWLAAGIALLITAAAWRAASLGPRAISWRRRLGVLAVVGVLWRGSPYRQSQLFVLAVVVWTGAIWVATLMQGRRISAAIAQATGEEGLGDDPSRHL